MAPLANDLIMSGTSIQSFRHLKHQNLSTGDDFIYSSGIFFLVPFMASREAVALLANDLIMLGTSIRSFRTSRSVYYFRTYRQSQDGATIPEGRNRTEQNRMEYSCLGG